jgi:hypothetical protein
MVGALGAGVAMLGTLIATWMMRGAMVPPG